MASVSYVGLLPDGDAPPPDAGVQEAIGGSPPPETGWGYGWREALRSKTFWLMALGHAKALVTVDTLPVYLGSFLDYRDSLRAGLVVIASTFVSAVFMFVGGYLGDRFAMRKVAFAFSAILALSVMLLVLAPATGAVLAFAVLFGMAMGGQTAVMVAMRGRYFGRKAFATITSLSLVPPGVLVAVAPLVAATAWDWRWDYDALFLILAAITLVGGIAFLKMGEPPRRPRLLADDSPLEQGPAEQPSP